MVSTTINILPHFAETARALEPSMTDSTQDFDLLCRLRSGDENALRDLYAAYGQRLYTYALRLTNDPPTTFCR